MNRMVRTIAELMVETIEARRAADARGDHVEAERCIARVAVLAEVVQVLAREPARHFHELTAEEQIVALDIAFRRDGLGCGVPLCATCAEARAKVAAAPAPAK